MIKVKEIMQRDLITVSPDTEIVQATRILLKNRINGLPVIDEKGDLVGILCQSDLVAQQKKIPIPSLFTFLDGFIAMTSIKQVEKEVKKIAAVTVAEAMTPNPVTIEPDADIETAATLMVDKNFHTIPVVEGGNVVGIVGKVDILRTLIPETEK